jgi:nitric oxide reductase NorD protein
MARITRQYDEFTDALVTNLVVDFFDDGEIDRILSEIGSYDPSVRRKVLALALALSHASSSLVPGLLRNIGKASHYLPLQHLDQWLNSAFDIRDAEGIDQALDFLSRVGFRDLKVFRGSEGLPLREAAPLLETYLRAISGTHLKIMADEETYTDTVLIYLPAVIGRLPDRDDNFGIYKLAAANCWAQISLGSLNPVSSSMANFSCRFGACPVEGTGIEAFFSRFPDSRLAVDLYTVIEAFRIEYVLMKELPGLMKQAAAIKHALYQERQRLSTLSAQSAFVEGLWQYYLAGRIKGVRAGQLTAAIAAVYGIQYETSPKESIKLLFDFYDTARELSGGYKPRPAPLFIARVRPDKVAGRLQDLQAQRKKKLEAAISKLVTLPDLPRPVRGAGARPAPGIPPEPAKEYLLIKGRLVEADEELKSLVEERGGIPGGTLVKGSEMGGESPLQLSDLLEENEEEAVEGGHAYDEWDYRRGGYRRRWCRLFEKEILPGRDPFVELTLKRYGGALSILRKKFELLRRERRMKRRQRDGDDIDLDAMVEAFSDLRAGVSPSENLFTRVDRQERDLAVLFLLDMSGSTRGWVNDAEKESLVLMSEALETLGDRYAVYGFSSMTRNRCDLFRIKAFNEPYGDAVRQRIAGIEPKDYTRMGPFVRHAAGLLKSVESRTRLLITLSDSRPEDWDGYKGDYAIEDTRRALIEASGQGIHPFCITIDREAQSYLPHLFGDVNYIFIDDVRKLPSRITEIYCRLTT